jgi:hypothetical protein
MKRIKEPSKMCTPVIPALRRLRREDSKFKASLGYIAKACVCIPIKKGREMIIYLLYSDSHFSLLQ